MNVDAMWVEAVRFQIECLALEAWLGHHAVPWGPAGGFHPQALPGAIGLEGREDWLVAYI